MAFAQGTLAYAPPPTDHPIIKAAEAAFEQAKAEKAAAVAAAAAAAEEAGEEAPPAEGEEEALSFVKPFVTGTWTVSFAEPEPIFLTRGSRFALKSGESVWFFFLQ